MKIQCDVCERAEAAVLCCADEAALCWACDDKVHAANKLAGKHQRVPLLPNNPSSSQVPICDICQEKAGYFFCLEDRALLCRHCDIGIHTASPYVSGHQRFLITGVKVALQHCLTNNTNSTSSNSNGTAASNSIDRSDSNKHPLRSPVAVDDSTAGKKWRPALAGPAMEEMGGFRPQWLWNEMILDSAELDQCYGFSEPGSSS